MTWLDTYSGSERHKLHKDLTRHILGSERHKLHNDLTRHILGSERHKLDKDLTRHILGSERHKLDKDLTRHILRSERHKLDKDLTRKHSYRTDRCWGVKKILKISSVMCLKCSHVPGSSCIFILHSWGKLIWDMSSGTKCWSAPKNLCKSIRTF